MSNRFLVGLLSEIRLLQVYLQFLRYLLELFWRLSWNIFTMQSNNSEFLVCLSVCQLAYFLTEIRKIYAYLEFCVRYLSELFWRLSWNIFTIKSNNSEFLVFLSVFQLVYFLTEIISIQIYLQFLKYLSELFRGFPGTFSQ